MKPCNESEIVGLKTFEPSKDYLRGYEASEKNIKCVLDKIKDKISDEDTYKVITGIIDSYMNGDLESQVGEWICIDYQRGKFKCSVCQTEGFPNTCMYKPIWKYCPICGSIMRVSDE